MSEFGEFVDGGYEPEKEYVYSLFVNYYNNPTMAKIKEQGNFSLYACKVYCLLNKECRYLIAVVNKDFHSIGTLEELDTIKWVAFQTRTLVETWKVPTHGYQPSMDNKLKTLIIRNNISNEASTYKCPELPIIITLLHTEKKTKDSYQQRGNVIAALETFETIVTFDENYNLKV